MSQAKKKKTVASVFGGGGCSCRERVKGQNVLRCTSLPDAFSHPCYIAQCTLFASLMVFVPLYWNSVSASTGVTIYPIYLVYLVNTPFVFSHMFRQT
jgi:hypothetical protein